MTFSIAGLTIELVAEDARARTLADVLFQDYASRGDAAPDLRVVVRGGKAIASDGREVRVAGTDGSYTIERADCVGTLDLTPQGGERSVDGLWARATVHIADAPHSLSSFVRVACALVLAGSGGMLLHAASVVREGAAYLFVGPSGVGKTSIARTLPGPGIVLSDEIAAVRRVGGQFRAFATPFWGDLQAVGAAPASAPVQRLLFPMHGSTTRCVPLSSASAVAMLLRSVVFFGADDALAARLVATAGDLVVESRPARLEFLPVPALWEVVDA